MRNFHYETEIEGLNAAATVYVGASAAEGQYWMHQTPGSRLVRVYRDGRRQVMAENPSEPVQVCGAMFLESAE